MRFTVIGGRGYIGSRLVEHLATEGYRGTVPEREWEPADESLGHVIYCAGLTADFRTRHHDTVEAHVCKVSRILERCSFESFLYLSSTRVYLDATSTEEDTKLAVDPADPDSLYALTKLTGEARCLAIPRAEVRVARISNVYGRGAAADTFLGSLMAQARAERRIMLRTSLDSAKDYVSIEKVVQLLTAIALHGRHRCYNVASGVNTTNEEIVSVLGRLLSVEVTVEKGSPRVVFPAISTTRIDSEFHIPRHSLREDLEEMMKGVVP